MKLLLIAACIAGPALWPGVSRGQQACPATVEAAVAVPPGEFSLADLLAKDTCALLRRAAARVALGAAPATGSARVLAAAEVRSLLQQVDASISRGAAGPIAIRVPERVTVRRAGARASCADIAHRLLAPGIGPAGQEAAPQELECGVADRIPLGSALERTRSVWNPALRSWDVSLRCVRREDCVPFLVRVRDRSAPLEIALAARSATRIPPVIPIAILPASPSGSPPAFDPAAMGRASVPLVRRGETVRLLWNQYGVRVTVPAICLESGAEGERVRARIVRGGRIVPAIVAGAGELRTAF